MHPNVHSSTIYNSQDRKQPKCPTTDDRRKTYTHTQWNITQPEAAGEGQIRSMGLKGRKYYT